MTLNQTLVVIAIMIPYITLWCLLPKIMDYFRPGDERRYRKYLVEYQRREETKQQLRMIETLEGKE